MSEIIDDPMGNDPIDTDDIITYATETSIIEKYLGNKSLLEITFGGSKRFIVVIMTLSLMYAPYANVVMPDGITNLCMAIIGLYFGVSALTSTPKIK